MELNELVVMLGSLAGFGAFVGVLVNLFKFTGWVKDGQAQTWSVGLNLVGMVLLFVLKVFTPEFDIAAADGMLGEAANILLLGLGFVTQVGSSKLYHFIFRGVKVIGKSL